MELERRDNVLAFLNNQGDLERNPEILRMMAENYDGAHYDIFTATYKEIGELLKEGKKEEVVCVLERRLRFLFRDIASVDSQAESLYCAWHMSCTLAEIYVERGDKITAEKMLDRVIKKKRDLGWIVQEEQLKKKNEILGREN